MYLLEISDAVVLAIIAMGGTFLTLVTQIIMAIIQNKARGEQQEARLEQKVLTEKVDGRLTQLLQEKDKTSESKEKTALLEGHKAGVEEQKAATVPPPPVPIKLEIGELKVKMDPTATPPPDKEK